MAAILILSLKQITGVRRLIIVGLLALLPVALTLVAQLALNSQSEDPEEFVLVVIVGLIVAVVLPIVTMALAISTFGNDLEDRTLSFVVMTPIAKWKIALPKLFAAILVAVPLTVISGVVTTILGLEGDLNAAAAVGAGLLIGVAAYASVFTWAGLMTTRAMAFSIFYVFVWEGVVSSFVPGVKYLSIKGYVLSIMYGLEDGIFEALEDQVIEFPAAIVGAALILAVFWLLTVYRLRTMDVP